MAWEESLWLWAGRSQPSPSLPSLCNVSAGLSWLICLFESGKASFSTNGCSSGNVHPRALMQKEECLDMLTEHFTFPSSKRGRRPHLYRPPPLVPVPLTFRFPTMCPCNWSLAPSLIASVKVPMQFRRNLRYVVFMCI